MQLESAQIYMSTKQDGDMRDFKQRSAFILHHGLNEKRMYFPKQIHSGRVHVVDHNSNNQILNADSLISTSRQTLIGVVTADCLPIVLFDPKENIVGSVHAGYKGILSHVIQNTIQRFLSLGSNPKNMLGYIGPSIGPCCYGVSIDRFELFKTQFSKYVALKRSNGLFLDLQKSAQILLHNAGVTIRNIQIANVCTSCNNDQYFSYRKDSKDTFGVFATIVGLA